ncbi:Signal transduction histidine kinase [Aquimarina amphilecti]|uniref:histidine kinase n=1 Tax=Aquimarina amphilecti TaxID=1038014 RepID=A0A1H7FCI8_AQUAM|nr:ATP-binding protein [Aquimarina amphilecti]SEK22142.1 Signal transduction histidine kinase [Aquimarina amphilecti]
MKSIKIAKHFICFLCLNLFFPTLYAYQYEEMSFPELECTIIHTEEHLNSIGRANSVMLIENIIDISSKFNTQQEYYLKGYSYNLLGKIHFLNKEYKKALKEYKIAELFIKELEGHSELIIDVNNNIALVYLEGFNKPARALKRIKNIYESSENLDKYYKHSLELNLANIYLKTRNYRKAYRLLKKCQKYFSQDSEHINELLITYLGFGEYYKIHNNYNSAIRHFEEAASIAEKNKMFRQAMTIYKKYEELLVKIGRQDRAYAILKKYTKHHETALETEKLETNQFKDKLVVSNKNNSIQTQKAKQSQTVSIFTLTLLILCLILFCFFIYNHRKTKVLGESLALRNKELKISKEKSDRLAAVKTKFISTVSHELRTPLYGVVGLSSILMERIKDEENHKFIKLMKFSADHLLNLINDVLQVTKMESYEISLDKAPYNIKNLADDIKNSFEYQADKNGNTLHLNFDKNIPNSLIGDQVRLSQIFINLISNANKFTKNGNIWLNFINPVIIDNKVKITFEIKDDGRGIPVDKQELIFDKFSQADAKDHTTGTGLGLNIVKKLVNLHGGDIKIKSKPGEGSNFYFSISFEVDPANKEENNIINNSKDCIPLLNEEEYTILIVEDNKINQIVTQNVLKTKGYRSQIADDGLIAVEMSKSNSYDLILMDLNMPNMGGMEATKIIREFNPNIPIIALTASDTQDTVQAILNPDSGFSDFLRKPYKNQEFFNKIESNLNRTISKAS